MTNPTTPTAADNLIYLSARLRDTIRWAHSSICEKLEEADIVSIEDELDQLYQLAELVDGMGTIREDRDHYSDGRPIWTAVQLGPAYSYSHLWSPNPAHDQPHTINADVPRGRATIKIVPPSTAYIENVTTLAVVPDADNPTNGGDAA